MASPGSITLVPSVHFSPTHRRRVRQTIRDQEPDVVAVELDERRYERLEGDRRSDPDLPPVIAVACGVLRTIQRSIVRLYGLDPSQTDMETAVETAGERGIDVALIDDPIAETLEALGSRVGPELLPKLVSRAQRLDPDQQARQLEQLSRSVEEITSGEDVQPAIEQLRLLVPELTEVMIDRRDRSMAARLHALRREGYDVVAVVGAGHHLGIEDRLAQLESATDEESLESETGESEGEPEPESESVTVPIRSPSRDVTRIPIE
ncbi:TraB domain-containing protein [Natronolimnohabitans innermongolicus]|uniref:TraB family protein n=1 Tax=Natronolimnohabitans innermongolicus JCM 12255 TaxID=1227499 RepID=L9WSC7_9EURY|nr:TraB domain-containing protein [Natronolimnohabitans innermongolicus]ELY52101.1 TraB family protein [Natronolimnohabitans innermongolicus JCM 12255]